MPKIIIFIQLLRDFPIFLVRKENERVECRVTFPDV